MVFEHRARYIYLHMPYFVMLGIVGWSVILRRKLKTTDDKKLTRYAYSSQDEKCVSTQNGVLLSLDLIGDIRCSNSAFNLG